MRVRADREERRVAEAHLPRVPHQQHEPDAGDRIDEHERHLAHVEAVETERHQQQRDRQQGVPETLTVVLEEVDVLVVARLEDESHTFFLCSVAKMPSGRMISITSRITYAERSPDPGGR